MIVGAPAPRCTAQNPHSGVYAPKNKGTLRCPCSNKKVAKRLGVNKRGREERHPKTDNSQQERLRNTETDGNHSLLIPSECKKKLEFPKNSKIQKFKNF